jgi:hypothetical protein
MIKIQNAGAKFHGKTKVGAGSGQSAAVVGKYFYAETHDYDKNKWWTLQSWYGNSSHTVHATLLPDASTDVVVLGSVEPTVDLDRQDWVQPNTINSGSAGIVFTSALSGNVSCDITGNATFNGNATYNK